MPFLFVFMMVFSSRFSVSRNTELTLSLSLRVSPKNFNQKIFVTACRLRTTSTAVVSLVRKKPTRIRPIWRGGGGGGNCLVCQIFTAEHETEASLSVCCGLGLLFVCCTLRCWHKQVHWLHEGSHVGQNRNNDQVMHTKGNDRWILYQLDFFYARAHSLLPATNERSRRFFGCEFNHLQYVARFMPYVLLLLERKMVHFSRHIPLLLEIGSHNNWKAENLANEPLTYRLHLI